MTLFPLPGYLEKLTGYIVERMHEDESPDQHSSIDSDSSITSSTPSIPSSALSPSTTASKTPDFLKVLTTPFTQLMVQLEPKVLKGWAVNDEQYVNATTILRLGCHSSSNSSSTSCSYLLAYLGPEGANLGEVVVGVVLLLVSLVMLCSCLIGRLSYS